MRKLSVLMLTVAACYLVFLREAKADVIAVSDVSYYEPTDSIWAWSEVHADYGTLASYCIGDVAYVYKNDVEVSMFNGSSCDSAVYGEVFLPYDPNAEYTVEANPGVDLRHQGADGSGYNDIYNFMYWANVDPIVYVPAYFGFNGPGPEVDIFSNSISLGTVFSLFTEGATAGPPHHMKVLSDVTEDVCGTKRRRIRLQVVDSSGRRAGTTPDRERFYNASTGAQISTVYNSCRNEQISPSGCSTDVSGELTDQLWVGCPTVSGSCGTSQFISKWLWCPQGRPEVVLTSNTYHIRNNSVTVNGSTQFATGTQLYP